MEALYLISEQGEVRRLEIVSARVSNFFAKEKASFQDDSSSLDDLVKQAIRNKGGRPEDMRVVHVFTLFSLCGRKKRKDVYEFLTGLNHRHSFRYLAC